MIDTDRSVRLLHPFPGLAWTEIREAAVECARRGWPVLPGTYQLAAHAGWLGRRDAAGLEPLAEFWQITATTDPATAMETWTQRPYSVLLACGSAVDAVEVPATHGECAQPLLAEHGHLGPITVTPFGTWLLFVESGGEIEPDLAERTRLHGPGCWVPLPPTARAAVPYRWRVGPGATGWTLPNPDDVQRVLINTLPQPSP